MMLRTLALLLVSLAFSSAQVCLWCCARSKAGHIFLESGSQHNVPETTHQHKFVWDSSSSSRAVAFEAPSSTFHTHSSPHAPHTRVNTHPQVSQVKLPYDLKDIAPTIDAQTMEFHYGTHYKAYVDNLNKALGTAQASVKSSDLTSKWFSLHKGAGG